MSAIIGLLSAFRRKSVSALRRIPHVSRAADLAAPGRLVSSCDGTNARDRRIVDHRQLLNALGLDVPLSLMIRADEMIE